MSPTGFQILRLPHIAIQSIYDYWSPHEIEINGMQTFWIHGGVDIVRDSDGLVGTVGWLSYMTEDENEKLPQNSIKKFNNAKREWNRDSDVIFESGDVEGEEMEEDNSIEIQYNCYAFKFIVW